uniref:Putative ecdysteroid kinase n=1 Tax=Lutzomyia longipalpis TaxID=7200 RepID=A0A1B0C979_LUTLO
MTEAKRLKIELKSEAKAPEFLNKSFFQDILRKHDENEDIEITKFELIPGSKLRDHFSSVTFRAVVSYKLNENEITRPLIVKQCPPADEVEKDNLHQVQLFDREFEMYTKVFPEMTQILLSIGDMNEIAPSLIYHNEERKILILEDITRNGFEEHRGFLDFDDVMKIIDHLASFHALSYYIYDNKYDHPIDLTKFPCMTTEKVTKMQKLFEDAFNCLKEEVATWPGYEMYAEKIGSLKETFMKDLLNAYQPHPGGFNVLCHGDFTIKNLMFTKSEGKISETIFLDFQKSFWASPAIDLFSLLYGIGNAECRKRRGEILLRYQEFFADSLHLYQSIESLQHCWRLILRC